jgi:hypothetical protein
MSDTPTPQTDAFENLGFLDQQMTWIDFARQLEHELAATQILLHESLIREDRFYRELTAQQQASKSHITYSLGDAIDATTAYVTGHD